MAELVQISTLPAALRRTWRKGTAWACRSWSRRFDSTDGTRRYLLRLDDGRTVETVLMPEEGRDTICISSQVGCPVDCKFCMTALMGLERNLTAGEIVGQVLFAARDNGWLGEKSRLNIVMMGMGEPLLNLPNVVKATRILVDPEGVGLSERRITLSTAGVIPKIAELAQEPVRPKLAVSLNASTEEKRQELMPITRKYHLKDLLAACRAYPLRPWEKLTFEYVLLERRQRYRRRCAPRGQAAGKFERQGESDCAESRTGDSVRDAGAGARGLFSGAGAAGHALLRAQAARPGYFRGLRAVEAEHREKLPTNFLCGLCVSARNLGF